MDEAEASRTEGRPWVPYPWSVLRSPTVHTHSLPMLGKVIRNQATKREPGGYKQSRTVGGWLSEGSILGKWALTMDRRGPVRRGEGGFYKSKFARVSQGRHSYEAPTVCVCVCVYAHAHMREKERE